MQHKRRDTQNFHTKFLAKKKKLPHKIKYQREYLYFNQKKGKEEEEENIYINVIVQIIT